MKLHHWGIAVKNIEKSKKKYELLGYTQDGNLIRDCDRNIKILFMENGETKIELIEKDLSDKPSPIDAFLNGRNNHQCYHACYQVRDINLAVDELTKNNFIMTAKPAEAIAFDNKKVCFMFNSNIGMIELVEE